MYKMDDFFDADTEFVEEEEDVDLDAQLDGEDDDDAEDNEPDKSTTFSNLTVANDITKMTEVPRRTLSRLSELELSALISERAKQLQKQAIPLISVTEDMSPEIIAKKEIYDLEARKRFPIKINRIMPDTPTYEVWSLTDFEIFPRF